MGYKLLHVVSGPPLDGHLVAESVSMMQWTEQTWISAGSAIVSVIGAAITLYWTHRGLGRWSRAWRPSTRRIESNFLPNKPQRSTVVGRGALIPVRALYMAIESAGEEPLMSSSACKTMEELSTALYAAERGIFGSLRRART